jgi:hypothetical protein
MIFSLSLILLNQRAIFICYFRHPNIDEENPHHFQQRSFEVIAAVSVEMRSRQQQSLPLPEIALACSLPPRLLHASRPDARGGRRVSHVVFLICITSLGLKNRLAGKLSWINFSCAAMHPFVISDPFTSSSYTILTSGSYSI